MILHSLIQVINEEETIAVCEQNENLKIAVNKSEK